MPALPERIRREHMIKSLKNGIEKRLSTIVLVILAIQPPLDVLSYFLGERGSNALSTALRFLLLMSVALLGFVVSEKKRIYLLFYGVAGLFWVLHMANCWRIGYKSMVADTANFLRIMNFPVFTLSFITFFQKGEGVKRRIYLGFAIDFLEILLFTALPWLLGKPVYTYELLQVGVMGWFGVANAQSAIIVLVIPLTLYWAFKKGKYPLYLGAVLLCFALLYVTGTKFTFYSMFIIAGAFAFLFVLNLGRKSWKYALPLVIAAVLVFVFRSQSPMALRERMSAYALGQYDNLVEESLENSGADEEIIATIKEGVNLENTSEATLEIIRRSLIGVYTDKEVYGTFLKNLHDRFGVYNVMKAYNYTTEPSILSDSRVRKSTFARLVWEEKDLPTRLLGFEYSDMLMGDATYDLENDFPAVFYFCGYLGFGLYLLFFAWFLFLVLRAFVLEVRNSAKERSDRKENAFRRGLGNLGQGIKRFLTVEMGAVGMTFLLAVIAAQISGNVLRRPNVTVYFAVTAACLYWLNLPKEHGKGPE